MGLGFGKIDACPPHRGGVGGNRNHTDLLATRSQKLQQFRKKKEKRGPGKKAKTKADAETEEGSSKSGEVRRLQVEQCNGQGPGTAESSTVDNVEVLLVQESGDGSIGATNADGCGDLVEGTQLGEVDVGEKPSYCSLNETTELYASSQDGITDDDGDNQIGEHQQVEIDPVERPSSSDFKEITEVIVRSEDIGADILTRGKEELEKWRLLFLGGHLVAIYSKILDP
ncbi:hypothetical protein ABZP36_024967 [Zizania latifolia]